jgi:hypothetical protein
VCLSLLLMPNLVECLWQEYETFLKLECHLPMEQCTLKNVNNCLNTNIYCYLETSGDQNSNLYLKVVHFFNTSVNKTSVAA